MRYIFSIWLLCIGLNLFSQNSLPCPDHVFGRDPVLYNGIKYTFFPSGSINGHQYLESAEFTPGVLTIRGKTYSGLLLNYDIYSQQLLLKYTDEFDAVNVMAVSNAWIESFSILNKTFRYIRSAEGDGFFQVIGDGPICILYSWRKNLEIENGKQTLAFILKDRSGFVLRDNHRYHYWNRRSFLAIFTPESRQLIRDFMHQHKIKINSASDQQMSELMQFINTL